MIDYYKVLTVNHTMTSLSNLGAYMIDESLDTHDTVGKIKDILKVKELMYLSTCNRVTYILYTNSAIDLQFIKRFISIVNPMLSPLLLKEMEGKIAAYEGIEAVRHIMEIAGSIDSLVVGEREIFRQFREAYATAHKSRWSGDSLRLLEQNVIRSSKSIYTNTRIGEKPLSIATLAMAAILNEPLESPSQILMIGAGATNQLLAKLLKPKQLGNFTVANRSKSNAESLAKFLNGKAIGLEELSEQASKHNIILVCTSSQMPLLTKENFKADPKKNYIIVDLSVPMNVAKQITAYKNVTYIYIEDLRLLAQHNLEERKKEIKLAKQIIEKSIEEFRSTYLERQLEVALADLPIEIRKVKHKALETVFAEKLAILDENTKGIIIEIMDYMEKKCIAIPMKAAKQKLLK